jgi:Amt family ammonium transporter
MTMTKYVFAATSATIVAGSIAERCQFIGYIIYSFVLTGLA